VNVNKYVKRKTFAGLGFFYLTLIHIPSANLGMALPIDAPRGQTAMLVSRNLESNAPIQVTLHPPYILRIEGILSC